MSADLVFVFIILLAIGGSLTALPRLLRRSSGKFSQPFLRNLAHSVSLVLCAFTVHVVDEEWVLVVSGFMAFLLLIAAVELRLIADVMDGLRFRDYGFAASAAGFVAAVLLFWPQKNLIIGALLIAGLADPIASTVGRHYGRHIIGAWGTLRSLEGSIAFASIAFAVSLVFFYAAGSLTYRAIGVSLFVSFTATELELILPSVADNIAIPLWSAFLFVLTTRHIVSPSRWAIAAGACAITAAGSHRLRWLDAAGAVAASLVGAIVIGLGGWAWFVPIFVFFVATSLLTQVKLAPKSAKEIRGIRQVFAKGIIPILPVLGYALRGSAVWYFLYVGAVAAANADTFATEVGQLAGRAPISLRTFRTVPPGTSGAITPLGTFASVIGGALIGAVAAIVGPAERRREVFLAGAIVGPLGSIIDSMMGAWFQGRYQCNACGAIAEEAQHCSVSAVSLSGLRGISNDVVNGLTNAMAMLISLIFFYTIR